MPFAQTVYTSVAPDTLRQVVVQEYGCSFDCAVRVVLKEKWRSETIASGDDCSVRFTHAAWKGTVVSVFVDGFWCGKIHTAYDTATGKPVDFASTEEWLRRDIVSAYQITPQELATKNGDVLAWVTYDGDGKARRATREFQARHRKRPQ
jgi:hypothetical protein